MNLQLNQELAMEFCACIDFVIILQGNLKPLKWKKIIWNCIIFRYFDPATIIDPLLYKWEGGIEFLQYSPKRASNFSHKNGRAGKGIVLKNEGCQIFSSVLIVSSVLFLSVWVFCLFALFLSFSFAFPVKDLVLFNLIRK